jgi:uncharacterized protein (DUF2336 family)
VQKRSHTRDEEHRYTELVLWLIASVDVATRAAVARKLASYAHAPRLVARRLARDVFEVAEPVLKWSPCLTSEDLLAIIPGRSRNASWWRRCRRTNLPKRRTSMSPRRRWPIP